MLLGEFDFERLELYLLVQQVILAVVAHVVDLLVVAGDKALAVGDFLALGHESLVEALDFGGIVVDTCIEAGNLVLEILHLKGQLATDGLYAVDFREDGLKLVERAETRLHRLYLFGFLFGSHWLQIMYWILLV